MIGHLPEGGDELAVAGQWQGQARRARTELPQPPASPWELEHSDTFTGGERVKFGIISHPSVNLFASQILCQGINGLPSGSPDGVIEAKYVNIIA